MKPLANFLKTTLIGGLVVAMPVWLAVLLLLKAVKGAMVLLMPIARLVPQGFVHENLVALVLPQTAIPVALLFFNVGVEVGQLLFIAGVFIIIALGKSCDDLPCRNRRGRGACHLTPSARSQPFG